jgi:hypothetical protein
MLFFLNNLDGLRVEYFGYMYFMVLSCSVLKFGIFCGLLYVLWHIPCYVLSIKIYIWLHVDLRLSDIFFR